MCAKFKSQPWHSLDVIHAIFERWSLGGLELTESAQQTEPVSASPAVRLQYIPK